MDLATGKLTKLQEIKGMMLYKVTSLAFDPDARTAYYTEDNYAFRDMMAVNVDTGKKRMLLKDARIGDMVLNPADKSIWGIRHQNGFATIVRIPPPYAGFNQIHTFKYGQVPFDLDISPDGSMLSASFGEVNGTQTMRVWKLGDMSPDARAGRGRAAGAAALDARKVSSSRPTARRCTARPIIPASRTSSASTSPRRNIDAVSNASTGFFRPIPQPDGSLVAYEYSGKGLQPVRLQPQVQQDLGTVEFLGTRVVKTHPELKSWGVGSPAKVALDS